MLWAPLLGSDHTSSAVVALTISTFNPTGGSRRHFVFRLVNCRSDGVALFGWDGPALFTDDSLFRWTIESAIDSSVDAFWQLVMSISSLEFSASSSSRPLWWLCFGVDKRVNFFGVTAGECRTDLESVGVQTASCSLRVNSLIFDADFSSRLLFWAEGLARTEFVSKGI